MYLWKAWHDCRARVALYILATLGVGALSGMEVMTWANWHAFYMAYPHSRFLDDQDFYASLTTYTLDWSVAVYTQLAVLLVGLSLGACSVGREYDAGTMNFVLTRPGPRRNFIITDWIVGLTATVIIVSGSALGVLPFLCLIHAKDPGNVLAVLPPLWVVGTAIYGLSHFTTLVAGSAPKGLILSVATVSTYFFLPTALHEWWHADALMKVTEWSLRVFKHGAWQSPFDWSVAAFWLAVAAGLLGASVAWIRFREV